MMKKLGHRKDQVCVIKSREELHDYISAAIVKGRIGIDTETNKSLDPITCKLMGPCLYVESQKAAYIPLHHRDPITKVEYE
jgi:DNA polymerase I-like protein with 3'-5' exonuclease and polymerase domains